MKRLGGTLLGLSLSLLASTAFAQNCKQLAIVTSVDLSTTKEHNAVFAPMNLDGKDELLLVDTGGAFSELTKETADDLNLDREPVNVGVVDVSGQVSYEAGRVKDVFSDPRHPYTKGLLDSAPDFDQPDRELVPIPGFPPNLAARTAGCAFAPRCAFAVDACTVAIPPTVEVAPGHKAACIESERIFEGILA